jgi:hypothetical protein
LKKVWIKNFGTKETVRFDENFRQSAGLKNLRLIQNRFCQLFAFVNQL